MQKKLIKFILPVIVVIAGVLWYLLSYNVSLNSSSGEAVFDLQQNTEECDNRSTSEFEELLESEVRFITVHVCGEVIAPGVYQLEEGSRVIQAVEAAGGFCAGAMQDYLNLAQVVSDGDKIYVPSKEDVEAGDLQGVTGTLSEVVLCVNINTATKSELMQLPGIGESKADSIISYRNEHGNFKAIEDIMLINGIKEAVYSQIKDYIKVKN